MIEEIFSKDELDEIKAEIYKQPPPIPKTSSKLIEEESEGLIEEEPKGLIKEKVKRDSYEHMRRHRHPMHPIIKKWLGIN